jgi:hypothetical protein
MVLVFWKTMLEFLVKMMLTFNEECGLAEWNQPVW